ncbi:unnamed protein product, partial [Urochloa humidicola]
PELAAAALAIPIPVLEPADSSLDLCRAEEREAQAPRAPLRYGGARLPRGVGGDAVAAGGEGARPKPWQPVPHSA